MKTIENIIYNLKSGQDQDFVIFNNELAMEWTLGFELIETDIYMMCNGSTLTGVFFESLLDLKSYLKNSFINDKNYQLY
jgi:hypothetical protein